MNFSLPIFSHKAAGLLLRFCLKIQKTMSQAGTKTNTLEDITTQCSTSEAKPTLTVGSLQQTGHAEHPYIPLSTVIATTGGVGSRSLMSADSVEKAVAGSHTHPSPSLDHGRAVRPLVGVGVEALHGLEARAAVPPTHCVQPETKQQSEMVFSFLVVCGSVDLVVTHTCRFPGQQGICCVGSPMLMTPKGANNSAPHTSAPASSTLWRCLPCCHTHTHACTHTCMHARTHTPLPRAIKH